MPPVARRVHPLAAVVFVAASSALSAGCTPIPLSLDEPDAEPDSPPAIVSVRDQTGTEFITGVGPVLTNITDGDDSTMTLALFDANPDDTLYVRAFRDLDFEMQDPARILCTVGASDPPSTTRTVTCTTGGFCSTTAQVQMNIMVCDRPPADSGPNYFSCEGGATYDDRAYQVSCTVLE